MGTYRVLKTDGVAREAYPGGRTGMVFLPVGTVVSGLSGTKAALLAASLTDLGGGSYRVTTEIQLSAGTEFTTSLALTFWQPGLVAQLS